MTCREERYNEIPGEPLTAFDTTLFIVNAAIVALVAVILVVVTKGRLGYAADVQAK